MSEPKTGHLKRKPYKPEVEDISDPEPMKTDRKKTLLGDEWAPASSTGSPAISPPPLVSDSESDEDDQVPIIISDESDCLVIRDSRSSPESPPTEDKGQLPTDPDQEAEARNPKKLMDPLHEKTEIDVMFRA